MEQSAKNFAFKLLKRIKKSLPPQLLYYLQPLRELLQNVFYEPQLTMALSPEVAIPPVELPVGFSFRPFSESPDRDAWVEVVDGILGEWDRKTADVFFFGDKYFDPALCMLLIHENRTIGTASGRIRKIKGQVVGEIHMVSVLPTYRGLGLGNMITVVVLRMLRDQLPGKDIILKTDNWRHAAVKTYTKLGFKVI